MGIVGLSSVIEWTHRVTRKPGEILVWVFTGMIITSTLYMVLQPLPGTVDDGDDDDDNDDEGGERGDHS